MDLGLTGARALIGGGSGGLGGAIAQALRDEGARTGLIGRPGEKLRRPPSDSMARPSPRTSRRRTARAQAVEAADRGIRRARSPRRQLRRTAAGRFDELDEAHLAGRHRRHAVERDPPVAGRAPAPARRRDPRVLVILSSSAREPIPGLTTSNLIRPGLAGLIKSLVAEIVRCGSTGSRRAGSRPTGSPRSMRPGASSNIPVEDIQKRTVERIPLGRYGDRSNWGGWAPSCCHPPRRTSRARSSRSMAG
jgi:3-oxoacyl-[acyl-carrier protein] reductase